MNYAVAVSGYLQGTRLYKSYKGHPTLTLLGVGATQDTARPSYKRVPSNTVVEFIVDDKAASYINQSPMVETRGDFNTIEIPDNATVVNAASYTYTLKYYAEGKDITVTTQTGTGSQAAMDAVIDTLYWPYQEQSPRDDGFGDIVYDRMEASANADAAKGAYNTVINGSQFVVYGETMLTTMNGVVPTWIGV
jgi:hypothetical protein